MLRHPPPLDARIEADRPITGALLAAASGQPLDLADRYCEHWIRNLRRAVASGSVIVFDSFVVGGPDALLLEVVHHIRQVRRAERLGHFDDEEEHWLEEHGDDLDAWWEPTTTTRRVIDRMQPGQEAHRLLEGIELAREVSRELDRLHEHWVSIACLGMTIERLVLELADGIRIGDAVVLDARLRGERLDGLRWAA